MLLQGAINSSVSQGVSIALGLQDSFSWREVAIAAASTGAAAQAGKWGQSVSSRFTGSPNLINLTGYLASGVASALIRTAFGGRMDVTAVAADVFGNALGNSIVDGMSPQPVPAAGQGRSGLNLDAEIEAGIASTRARNEAELLGMAMPRLDNNPVSVFNPGSGLTPDQQRSLAANQPDPVAVMQQALAREEAERVGGANRVGYGPGGYYNEDGALVVEITRGANDLPPLNANESAGALADGRASMRDYWTAAQDNADSFLGYAGAGVMRFLGDVGYSAAEMGAAIYNDPQGAFVGAGKAIVNFGPESFNALTNLTKTSLNGWTMLAETTIAPQGTFAGFRESDPYNIELLAPYANRAEAGGALLANVGLGVGLAKYGNVALQSPVYLDLQQGAVAYSNIPIGVRSPFVRQAPVEYTGGEFSIIDLSDYPAIPGVPRPAGPARLLQGEEYRAARAQADAANSALRSANPSAYAGKQIHEILPVKFGGDPVGIANKVVLAPADHYKLNAYFLRLQRYLEGKGT